MTEQFRKRKQEKNKSSLILFLKTILISFLILLTALVVVSAERNETSYETRNETIYETNTSFKQEIERPMTREQTRSLIDDRSQQLREERKAGLDQAEQVRKVREARAEQDPTQQARSFKGVISNSQTTITPIHSQGNIRAINVYVEERLVAIADATHDTARVRLYTGIYNGYTDLYRSNRVITNLREAEANSVFYGRVKTDEFGFAEFTQRGFSTIIATLPADLYLDYNQITNINLNSFFDDFDYSQVQFLNRLTSTTPVINEEITVFSTATAPSSFASPQEVTFTPYKSVLSINSVGDYLLSFITYSTTIVDETVKVTTGNSVTEAFVNQEFDIHISDVSTPAGSPTTNNPLPTEVIIAGEFNVAYTILDLETYYNNFDSAYFVVYDPFTGVTYESDVIVVGENENDFYNNFASVDKFSVDIQDTFDEISLDAIFTGNNRVTGDSFQLQVFACNTDGCNNQDVTTTIYYEEKPTFTPPPPAGGDIDPADVVAYYTFDENTGTTAGDSKGSNDFTLSNSNIWSTVIINSGLDFNSIYNAKSQANLFVPQRNEEFSISLWGENTGEVDMLISTRDVNLATANRQGIIVFFTSNKFQFIFSSSNNKRIQVETPVISTGLRHIVINYDGSSNANGVKIYIDEVEQSLTTLSDDLTADVTHNTNILHLGVEKEGSGVKNYNTRKLDELAIFDKALTADEISFLYASGSPTTDQQYPFPTGTSEAPTPKLTNPSEIRIPLDTFTVTDLVIDDYFDIGTYTDLTVSINATTYTGYDTNKANITSVPLGVVDSMTMFSDPELDGILTISLRPQGYGGTYLRLTTYDQLADEIDLNILACNSDNCTNYVQHLEINLAPEEPPTTNTIPNIISLDSSPTGDWNVIYGADDLFSNYNEITIRLERDGTTIDTATYTLGGSTAYLISNELEISIDDLTIDYFPTINEEILYNFNLWVQATNTAGSTAEYQIPIVLSPDEIRIVNAYSQTTEATYISLNVSPTGQEYVVLTLRNSTPESSPLVLSDFLGSLPSTIDNNYYVVSVDETKATFTAKNTTTIQQFIIRNLYDNLTSLTTQVNEETYGVIIINDGGLIRPLIEGEPIVTTKSFINLDPTGEATTSPVSLGGDLMEIVINTFMSLFPDAETLGTSTKIAYALLTIFILVGVTLAVSSIKGVSFSIAGLVSGLIAFLGILFFTAIGYIALWVIVVAGLGILGYFLATSGRIVTGG